jgi:hypothetical protein
MKEEEQQCNVTLTFAENKKHASTTTQTSVTIDVAISVP